jgi:hypothetical protein
MLGEVKMGCSHAAQLLEFRMLSEDKMVVGGPIRGLQESVEERPPGLQESAQLSLSSPIVTKSHSSVPEALVTLVKCDSLSSYKCQIKF